MFTKLKINFDPGVTLLESIREQGVYLPAPCGGKGICGKCRVDVEGVGVVQACRFYPDQNVVVTIPQPSVMQVLTESFWPDPEPVPDLFPSEDPGFLGLAVDLGTTTVVVFLEDLLKHRNIGITSFPNPQHAYGADVVSRIHFCSENEDGTNRLQKEIVSAIEQAAAGLCAQHGFFTGQARRMVVTGNPTMLHLFKGVNPVSLAIYPFTPVFLEEQNVKGAEIGFTVLSEIRIEIAPSVSAYIGADIVAGLASVSLNPPLGWSLFLDIGTNGEMVLWNGTEILACATAAGPAFEGARISCGMAGIEGAVSVIGQDRYETIGGKPAVGLCGSGLVDAVALLLDAGKIDGMGYMEGDEELISGKYNNMPLFSQRSSVSLSLIPQDIREVQLAKGAIAAGIKVLMLEAGIVADEIRQVFMAGGFGYALHDWSAGRIGLIPDGLEKRQIRAGNTSGLGARLWLHSAEFSDYTRELARGIRYVELSEHPEFNDLFMWEMTFTENL